MGAKVDIRIPEAVRKRAPLYNKAQLYLDNEVLKDCSPYVPRREGYLLGSGIRGTKIGSGEVVYNAPYARRMYYGVGFHFSTAKNAKACAQWFEKAKAVNCKKWEKGVNTILRG